MTDEITREDLAFVAGAEFQATDVSFRGDTCLLERELRERIFQYVKSKATPEGECRYEGVGIRWSMLRLDTALRPVPPQDLSRAAIKFRRLQIEPVA
jgi:hypothetical protein